MKKKYEQPVKATLFDSTLNQTLDDKEFKKRK